MTSLAGGIVRFGPFELDPRRGEVRKNGTKVKVQDQPYRVLLLLLDRQGEIVTRDELKKVLWADDTFVDFDHSLNATVNRLREILRDSAANPRFVETVPRRGYRFIAPVERTEEAPELQAPALVVASSIPASPNYKIWIAVAFLTALSIAVLIWLRPRSTEGFSRRIPLTTYPGVEVDPAFSPDGSQVAFAWNGGESSKKDLDVFLKVAGDENPRRLTATPENDDNPAWSPDGRHIGFARWISNTRVEYLLVSPLGNSEQTLWESRAPATGRTYGRCLAWMPDSKAVVLVTRDSEDAPDRLVWLSLESRERRPLTSPPAGITGDTAVAVSPDGRALVFARVITYGSADLYLLRMSPEGQPLGEPRRLTSAAGMEMDPAWTPDGQSVIYAAGPVSSNTRLWKLDAWAGNKPLEFGAADIDARSVALDPRGGRMAYMVKRYSANIWSLDLMTGTRPLSPLRLIASNSINQMPDYSPDGNAIAFESTRTGAREIWTCGRDGSGMTQLTHFQADTGAPRWSPDGSRIAFFSNFHGNREIYSINVESRAWTRITDDPADDAEPAWSRDGRCIYFTSDRSGRRTTWKIPSGGGQPRPVADGGEFTAGESSDGRSLYYARKSGSTPALWSISLHGGGATKIVDSFVQRNTAVVSDGVYFVPASEPYRILYRDFATGRTRELLTMGGYPAWGLAVSPDERTLLFSQEGEVSSDLVLLEGLK